VTEELEPEVRAMVDRMTAAGWEGPTRPDPTALPAGLTVDREAIRRDHAAYLEDHARIPRRPWHELDGIP
jgi:hypothetical protein